MTYLEKGQKVVAGSSDGLLRLYESETLQLLDTLGVPQQVGTVPVNAVTDLTKIPERNKKYSSFVMATCK